jgi:hypothetical protein
MDVTVLIKTCFLIRSLLSHAYKVILNNYIKIDCPLTTFAHSGLCVDCPANCNNCSIDGFGRRFL